MAIATRTANCRSSAGERFRGRTCPRIRSRASMNSLSSLACSGQLIARPVAEYIKHLLKTAKGKITPRRKKSKHSFSPYVRPNSTSFAADPDDLSGLDRFEMREAIGYEGQKIFEQTRRK
jgi:hypothetical protein